MRSTKGEDKKKEEEKGLRLNGDDTKKFKRHQNGI